MNKRILFSTLLGVLAGCAMSVLGAQQTLQLKQSWNLVSLFLQPQDSSVSAVFTNLISQNRLVSVFTYEYVGFPPKGVWKRYYPSQPADRAWINTVTDLKPLQGYWINLTAGTPVSITVTGSVGTNLQVALQPGWNLIGLGNDRDAFWADALGSSAGAVQGMFVSTNGLSFQGFGFPRFLNADINGDGFIAANEFDWVYTNEVGRLRTISPGQGCWVKVGLGIPIGPSLEVEVESDVDPFAPGDSTNSWFQSGIDTDINGNGILDYGFTRTDSDGFPQFDPYGNPYLNTQDTIWFRVPTGATHSNLVNLRQDITVLNAGNGGLLHFEVEETLPWLSANPASGTLLPGAGGQVVQLKADISALAIGEQVGTLRIRSDGGVKDYTVKLTIPSLDGTYAGEVIITNLQSRSAIPMRWPVSLTLHLQGLSSLNASGAPYITSDITMTNAGTAAQFDLSGSTTLAADDVKNPFGVTIQRVVRFRGGRILPAAGQASGMNLGLVGEYNERLIGLRSGDIVMSGFFSLNAKTDKKVLEEP